MSTTITIKGPASFVYLGDRKDTYGGKERSSVTLGLTKAEAERINAAVKEELEGLPKAKRASAKKPIRKDDEGNYSIKVSTQNDVKVFDSKNVLIPKSKLKEMRFGDGTILKVKANLKTYENETSGVGAYLTAVMVVKYVPYTGGSDGFDDDEVEEDGFSEEDAGFDSGDDEQSEADRLGDQEDDL